MIRSQNTGRKREPQAASVHLITNFLLNKELLRVSLVASHLEADVFRPFVNLTSSINLILSQTDH